MALFRSQMLQYKKRKPKCRKRQSRVVMFPVCKSPVVSSKMQFPTPCSPMPCPKLPANLQLEARYQIPPLPFHPVPPSPILSPAAEAWAIPIYQFGSSS